MRARLKCGEFTESGSAGRFAANLNLLSIEAVWSMIENIESAAASVPGKPALERRNQSPDSDLRNLARPAGLRYAQSADRPPARAKAHRSVILEADDLGLVYAFNEGIRVAYQEGVLTSTCIRANGYAYDHAVREILPACPGLGLGIHLCLNEAGCVAPPSQVPLLLEKTGCLRGGFFWLIRLARTAAGSQQIELEFRAQIEKVLSDGLDIDHLNSHQHVHMIPSIFRITCRLSREYGIPAVRLTRELPYWAGGVRKRMQPFVNSNFLKHILLNNFARVNEIAARRFGIPTTDYFVGVNYTAHMNLAATLGGIRAAPYGSVEVLLHPAIGPDPRDARYPTASLFRYVTAPQREMELQSLRSAELSEFLRRENWVMTRFADWAAEQKERWPKTSTPEISDAIRTTCMSVDVSCPPWVSAAQDDSRVFAQLVVNQSRPGQRVLDIGTGTGIIAICLARMQRDVVAADISGAAIRTARGNARRNGVGIECVKSDLLASVVGRYDLIAFNPPYNFAPDNLATNVAKHVLRKVPMVRRNSGLAMPRPVLRFHQQLIERLIGQAPEHLTPGGQILLHAYLSEVPALTGVLPEGAEVELLEHVALTNHTVGMLIKLPGA